MRRTLMIASILALAAAFGAALASGDVMDRKSTHAERIFRHLATGELEKVVEHARELETVTLNAGFEYDDKQSGEYAREFLKIIRALGDEADRGNMAGSYYQFTRMAGVCFACHEHIREKKR